MYLTAFTLSFVRCLPSNFTLKSSIIIIWWWTSIYCTLTLTFCIVALLTVQCCVSETIWCIIVKITWDKSHLEQSNCISYFIETIYVISGRRDHTNWNLYIEFLTAFHWYTILVNNKSKLWWVVQGTYPNCWLWKWGAPSLVNK